MCRFAMYLGPEIGLDALLTLPRNSLIHQSYEDEERSEPLNGDGFGVAWYVPKKTSEPAIFRSISPAWSNANLASLARVTESACVLAHVRAATPGLPVAETNCHPFTAGKLAFMHNGEIGGFSKIKRRLIEDLSDDAYAGVNGSTDSEHLFALLRDRLTSGDAHSLARALEAAIARVRELQAEAGVDGLWLNIAVSDGERAVATRYASSGTPESLYTHIGRRYECDGEVCRMVEVDESHGAVLVCSEKLSDDPGWEAVPPNHLVVVEADRTVFIRPLA